MSPAQAGRAAEKTGKVVRNDEVGPGIQAWQLGSEAAAAMSSREWTPGMRSTEGRRSPGGERDYGSNVGGLRASLGRIPREEVGNPRPGLVGTRTLERSEAQEGRRSMVAAMRNVETAKQLVLEGPAERSVRTNEAREWPNSPARAAAQVNYRCWRESTPFAAALKSP
jgi:hypothetical protein